LIDVATYSISGYPEKYDVHSQTRSTIASVSSQTGHSIVNVVDPLSLFGKRFIPIAGAKAKKPNKKNTTGRNIEIRRNFVCSRKFRRTHLYHSVTL